MKGWKKVVAVIATNVEERFDEAKFRLQQRLGLGKLMIVSYIGYGTPETLHLKGRVLRDKGISVATDNDALWTNLVNMYKRYESDEIPGALVRARFGGKQQDMLTDEEGYFNYNFILDAPLEATTVWHDVELELVDYPGKALNPEKDNEVKTIGKVIVPPPGAQFGVISDIDDTVMRTDVLNIFSMASNTFLNNSRTRLPFEGVSAFYDALRKGVVEGVSNPIFYVSSSPWNLYDLISDFFVVRGIPSGPLFLVDLGIDRDKLFAPSHHEHKTSAIQTLLDSYPDLPFILVGDSGQKDPEIYFEMAQKNPGRIQTIYIRDVTAAKRDLQINAIIDQTRLLGPEMIFTSDTLDASKHALERGYILPQELPEIREERDQDKQAPTPLEQALNPDDKTEV